MKTKKLLKHSGVAVIIILGLITVISILIVFMSARMTEKHTSKIASMFIDDMGYDLSSFTEEYSPLSEQTEITSRYGHSIPITYFKKDNTYNNKTVVLVHWHESYSVTMYPLTEYFLNQGYNVVVYDQRAHGGNTAKTVTFGYYEKDDLGDVINYVESKSTEEVSIGLLGQSMGASTVGYYLGTEHSKEHIDYAIMDSPFNSMFEEIQWNIRKVAKSKLISESLTKTASAVNNLIYGFNFKDVNIIASMKSNSIPTLLIHSKSDKVCPYRMGESLFMEIPHENKKLITFDNTKHVQAYFQEREDYLNELQAFLKLYSE